MSTSGLPVAQRLARAQAEAQAARLVNVNAFGENVRSGAALKGVKKEDIETFISNAHAAEDTDNQIVARTRRNEGEILAALDAKFETLENLRKSDQDLDATLDVLDGQSDAAMNPLALDVVRSVLAAVHNIPGVLEGLHKSGVEMEKIVFDSIRTAKRENAGLREKNHDLTLQVNDLTKKVVAVEESSRNVLELSHQETARVRAHLWRVVAHYLAKTERLGRIIAARGVGSEAALQRATEDREKAQNVNKDKDVELQEARCRIEQLEEDVDKLRHELADARTQNSNLEVELTRVTSERDVVRTSNSSLSSDLSERDKELTKVNVENRDLSKRERKLHEDLVTETMGATTAQADLELTQQDRDRAQNSLAENLKELQITRGQLQQSQDRTLTLQRFLTRQPNPIADDALDLVSSDLNRLLGLVLQMRAKTTSFNPAVTWLAAAQGLQTTATEASHSDPTSAILQFWCECVLHLDDISYENLHTLMECLSKHNDVLMAQVFVTDAMQRIVDRIVALDTEHAAPPTEAQLLLVLRGLEYLQRKQQNIANPSNPVTNILAALNSHLDWSACSVLTKGLAFWLNKQLAPSGMSSGNWTQGFISSSDDTAILDPDTCAMNPGLHLIADPLQDAILVVNRAEDCLERILTKHVVLISSTSPVRLELGLRVAEAETVTKLSFTMASRHSQVWFHTHLPSCPVVRQRKR